MRFSERRRNCRSAFTVLEITVVLCTIVLLISLLLPAIQQAREQARLQQCRQNLAQIGIAFRSYHDAHRCLPSGVVNSSGPVVSRPHDVSLYIGGSMSSMGGNGYGSDYGGDYGGDYDADYGGAYGDQSNDGSKEADGGSRDGESLEESAQELAARQEEVAKFNEIRSEYLLSWLAQILSQLDRQTAYRQIDFQTPQLSFVSKADKERWRQRYENWTTVSDAEVPWFPKPSLFDMPFLHCPSRASSGIGDGLLATNYAGCYSSVPVPIDTTNDGLLYLNSSESMEDVADGASNTILVGEAADGIFRSFYYGDHSSLRATVQIALNTRLDRYQDYSQRGIVDADEMDLATDPLSKGFSSSHNVVTQFLFADGAVQAVSTMIDGKVFQQLGCRNDGIPISADRF